MTTYSVPQKKFYFLIASHSVEILVWEFEGIGTKIFGPIPGIFSKMKYLLKCFV